MNHVIKLFRILFAATVLAAFALPSMAAVTKTFYAKFPAVGSVPMAMLLQNTSNGGGTSTINSFSVEVLDAGVTILNIEMVTPTTLQPTLTPTQPASKRIVTSFPGITKQSNATFRITLSTGTCPSGGFHFVVKANAGNNNQLNGDDFVDTNDTNGLPSPDYIYVVSCSEADLICPSGQDQYPAAQTSFDDGSAEIFRFENKDGSACVPIASSVTFDASARKVTVLWDETTQYSVLGAHIDWPAELSADQGLPKSTMYSTDDNSPSFIAPMCLSSLPPESYGTLTAGINNSVTSFQITISSALPTPPFPIVIASSVPATLPERMLVTNVPAYVGPGNYTIGVTRPTGSTPASPHALGAKVMSTPAPISADVLNGPINKPVKACIYKEFFVSKDFPDASDCPVQTGPEPLKGCFKAESWLYLFGDLVMQRP